MSFRSFPLVILTFISFQSKAQSLTLGVPEVNAEFWQAHDINHANNCYNYATNRAEGNWAQPGEASGAKYETITCDALSVAASKDWGLTPTQYFPLEENKEDTLIALVVNPGIDYHWYRRGANNQWSHKLNLLVMETDSSEKIITDPVTADRGRYRDFCGYFKVKNYLAYPQQQNTGYVRIGKMTDWPRYSGSKFNNLLTIKHIEESKFVLQIFSGRENPSISLQQILKDPVTAEILAQIGQLVKSSLASPEIQTMSAQRSLKVFSPILGSSSVVVFDSEGIIFPQESVVELKENFIKVTLKNSSPVILKSSIAADLQRHLMIWPLQINSTK